MGRFELFVPRATWAAGLYTAAYTSTLKDLNSLQGMSFDLVQGIPINPKTYMESDYKNDPLCPFAGELFNENDRQKVKSLCAAVMPCISQYNYGQQHRQRLLSSPDAIIGIPSRINR